MLVIGIAEPATKYLYSKFVDPECKISNVVYADIRNRLYEKSDLLWMFIQHTATTAKRSMKEEDRKFIKEVLRPTIKRVIDHEHT